VGAHARLPRQAPLSAARRPLALAIVGLGAALAPLDIAVNIALPAIVARFGLALDEVQWIVVCYVLVYGSLMLVCGRLGDVFGHRRVFRAGLAVSAVACAACAAAPDWPFFLWARALQGVGTALSLACAPALATELYPPAERTRALGAFAAMQAGAATAGPLLGGAVLALWDWSAVYWMRVPLALAVLAGTSLLPSPRRTDRPFDARGAALLAAATATLLLAFVLVQRPAMPALAAMGMFVASAVLLVWFVAHARDRADPILRPGLFADLRFALPNVMNVAAHLTGFAILLLTPFYLLQVLGLSPVAGGLMLALAPFASTLAAPLAARAAPHVGRRPLAAGGIAVMGLALLGLATGTAATPVALVAALLVLHGLGSGVLALAYTDIVTATLPAADRGVAGSLSLLTRTLGIVGGAAALTTLHRLGADGVTVDGFLAGYRFAFFAGGAGLLGLLALSALRPSLWRGD